MSQDLLVQSRFRNAILWEQMAGRTSAEICREIGCEDSQFGALLNLKISPTNPRRGGWRTVAIKIADYFRMLPEDLFPASLYALTLPDRVERTYESEQVMLSLQCAEARMLPDATSLDDKLNSQELTEKIDETLGTLSPREAKIIVRRFGLDGDGEHTLEEVGEEFAINKERVRQIEARALRHLRHPSRSKNLRPFLDITAQKYL